MGGMDGRRSARAGSGHGDGNEGYLGDSPINPVWIAEIPLPRNAKRELVGLALSLIPLAVMILVTRPDIRRMIVMRSSLFVKRVADAQEYMWSNVAMKAAQSYQNARL
jgi:hypothetical protein